MFKIIFLLFLIINIFLVASLPVTYDDEESNSNLLSVAVLFRHGDRTPIGGTWPTDKYYNNDTLFPQGSGQLNEQGKLHQYQLGQWLRQRYNDFLSETYTPSDIYVRSTNVKRNLESAVYNLVGLYNLSDPVTNPNFYNLSLTSIDIPVNTMTGSLDPVLAAKEYCLQYVIDLIAAILSTNEFVGINGANKELFANFSIEMGVPITDFSQLSIVYSRVEIYKSYGLDVPSWVEQYWAEITAFTAIAYQIPTLTETLARLRKGPFFDYLFEHFDKVLSQQEEQEEAKFLMLSAHDVTIADVLNSMGVFNDAPPEFTSTIIWELRSNEADGKNFMNIFFKNSTHFEKLTLKGYSDFNCEFEQFKGVLKNITLDVVSWNEECDTL